MTPASQPATTRRLGLLLVALPACAWGCWSLVLRPSGLSAFETTPIVFASMGLFLLPSLRFSATRPTWDGRSLAMLAGLAVANAVNCGTFFAAMDVTSVAIAVLTHYFAPLLVALLSPHVGEERVPGAAIWAAVALAGLALVLQPWKAADEGALLGAMLGLTSALGYACNIFLLRRLAARVGPARALSFHALGAALLLAPLADVGAIRAAGPTRLLLLVGGAVALGAIAGTVYTRGLLIVGPTRAAMLCFLEPLVAVIVGFLAWDEPLSAGLLVGGALVVLAGFRVSVALPASSIR